MTRIDDKTTVPLVWVGGFLTVSIVATITGCFWVFRVDERLARIESKLGILSMSAPTAQVNGPDIAVPDWVVAPVHAEMKK